MKTLNIFLAFIIAVIVMSCNRQTADNGKAVNPLLGDISFVSKFGHQPTATTDEDLRIKTHLEYVEKLLRLRDVSSLTPQLKLRRNHLLDFLHDYWTAGIFPRNYDYPDKRVPCFIDKNGRICAVGYLIEQTVGRQTAEQINEKHKYEKLMAINDRTVDSWVATSGLTKEECAMIQPTYGEPIDYNNNHISTNYAITSSVLGATNISLSTINIIQISNGTDNKTAAIIGLLTGAGSIVIGAVNFPNETGYVGHTITNKSQKTLSIVNIGLGTATIISSIWNLLANKSNENKSVAYNIYSFPAANNQVGFGLSLIMKL